mmetsp:Transcript_42129/g.86092  ORF Transcript_42129/g.86092 Transcript_42129/m.86092 type:complete len:248 (+) Transcript_42129:1473-2216(+)
MRARQDGQLRQPPQRGLRDPQGLTRQGHRRAQGPPAGDETHSPLHLRAGLGAGRQASRRLRGDACGVRARAIPRQRTQVLCEPARVPWGAQGAEAQASSPQGCVPGVPLRLAMPRVPGGTEQAAREPWLGGGDGGGGVGGRARPFCGGGDAQEREGACPVRAPLRRVRRRAVGRQGGPAGAAAAHVQDPHLLAPQQRRRVLPLLEDEERDSAADRRHRQDQRRRRGAGGRGDARRRAARRPQCALCL